MLVLWQVGGWYKRQQSQMARPDKSSMHSEEALPSRTVARSMVVLLILIFSKFFYLASLNSYYIFFLISKFHLSVQSAQIHLFVFLSAVAIGTVCGGHIGDRIGRKRVIWVSILGVAPFTLILPYATLAWTGPLTFIIGLILASAFPAILVFAQELLPGKSGDGIRAVFRTCIRYGRYWCGGVGETGRFAGYRLCLPGVRIPAVIWIVDGFSAGLGKTDY